MPRPAPAVGDCWTRPKVVIKSQRDWKRTMHFLDESATMIEYIPGDILKCRADALVNTVNCVGVMGRGLALQFKNSYPENFRAYKAACDQKEVQPGRMFVYETGQLAPRFIINFPTKRHWRDKSRIEDIEAGLVDLVRVIREKAIRSIAVPPLGCGLGGLDWCEVRSRIEQALGELSGVRVLVFEPSKALAIKPRALSSRIRING